MAPGSRAERSPCVNPPANLTGEQDELVGQSPVRRFNIGSNKARTKAPTLLEGLIPSLVSPSTKDLFTKFMKVFMETM